MKKGTIAVIAVIVIAGGAFAIFRMHSKSYTNNTTSSSQHTAAAVSNAVLVTKTNTTIGQYLANPSGRALYTYNADTKGVSNCTGSCLQAWPAYVATSSTANLPAGVGTIKRTDNGQIQYTYNGMPLYFFAGDSNGQVTGNGVQNFSVAKPSAASTSSQASNASPSSSSSDTSGW